MNEIVKMVFEEYDRKFELVALLDKDGRFIKYI